MRGASLSLLVLATCLVMLRGHGDHDCDNDDECGPDGHCGHGNCGPSHESSWGDDDCCVMPCHGHIECSSHGTPNKQNFIREHDFPSERSCGGCQCYKGWQSSDCSQAACDGFDCPDGMALRENFASGSPSVAICCEAIQYCGFATAKSQPQSGSQPLSIVGCQSSNCNLIGGYFNEQGSGKLACRVENCGDCEAKHYNNCGPFGAEPVSLAACRDFCDKYKHCGGFLYAPGGAGGGYLCWLYGEFVGVTGFVHNYADAPDMGDGTDWRLYLNDKSMACKASIGQVDPNSQNGQTVSMQVDDRCYRVTLGVMVQQSDNVANGANCENYDYDLGYDLGSYTHESDLVQHYQGGSSCGGQLTRSCKVQVRLGAFVSINVEESSICTYNILVTLQATTSNTTTSTNSTSTTTSTISTTTTSNTTTSTNSTSTTTSTTSTTTTTNTTITTSTTTTTTATTTTTTNTTTATNTTITTITTTTACCDTVIVANIPSAQSNKNGRFTPLLIVYNNQALHVYHNGWPVYANELGKELFFEEDTQPMWRIGNDHTSSSAGVRSWVDPPQRGCPNDHLIWQYRYAGNWETYPIVVICEITTTTNTTYTTNTTTTTTVITTTTTTTTTTTNTTSTAPVINSTYTTNTAAISAIATSTRSAAITTTIILSNAVNTTSTWTTLQATTFVVESTTSETTFPVTSETTTVTGAPPLDDSSTSTTPADSNTVPCRLSIIDGRRTFTLVDQYVRVQAYLTFCGAIAPQVVWSWLQLTPVASSNPTTLQTGSLEMRANMSSFNGVGTYQLRCEAPSLGQVVSIDITINSYPPPTVILIAPSLARTTCDVLLDASSSIDLSGRGLSFRWSCTSSTACKQVVDGTSEPFLRISGGSLAAGDYTFWVNVLDRSDASINSSAFVTIAFLDSSTVEPPVGLKDPPQKISAQVPLEIPVAVAGTGTCKAPAWRMWWLISLDDGKFWNLTHVEEYVSPSLYVSSLPAPPGRYKLRLVLTGSRQMSTSADASNSIFAYDTSQFLIDAGPIGGTVKVTPASGFVVRTTFEISTHDWIDEDIPIMYRILQHQRLAGGRTTLVPLTQFQMINFVDSIFGTEGNTILEAEARDSLGSVSTAAGVAELLACSSVMRNTSQSCDEMAQLSDELLLAKLTSISSYGSWQSTVNAVVAIGNYKGKDKTLAEGLLRNVAASGALTDFTSDALDRVAIALNTIVGPGVDDGEQPTLDISTADAAIDLALSVAGAASQVATGLTRAASENLLATAASLLPTVDFSTNSTSNVTDKKASLSTKIINMVSQKLPDILLSGVAEDEGTFLEERGLALIVSRIAASSSASKSMGSLTVPSSSTLGFNASGNEACSNLGLANIRWPSNPFAYAGDDSSSITDANGSNATASVSVADASVQSIEVRACGKEHRVHNLSTPVMFDLWVEGSNDTTFTTYDPTLMVDELTITIEDIRLCKFWDYNASAIGAWSTEGCWVIRKYADRIRCGCNHLSSFAGAFSKKFGSVGNNNAAILMKAPKIDFSHTPFQVALVWLVLIYSPLCCCCWLDRKDYKWLSQRSELFLDKVPRHSTDFVCMVVPGFRICAGMIACAPTFINCSLWKRRILWVYRGGCWRSFKRWARRSRTLVLEEAGFYFDEKTWGSSEKQRFVGVFGPEVQVRGAPPHASQILWPTTDPPLRKHIWLAASHAQEQISSGHDINDAIGGMKCSAKTHSSWADSLQAVRKLRRNEQPVPHIEHSNVASVEKQVLSVNVCHLIVEHKTVNEKKAYERRENAAGMKKAYNDFVYSNKYREAELKREVMRQSLRTILAAGNMVSISASPPPLHAVHAQVVSLKGEGVLGMVKGFDDEHILFFWTCPDTGALVLHEGTKNEFDAWALIGNQHSILIRLTPESSVRVVTAQGVLSDGSATLDLLARANSSASASSANSCSKNGNGEDGTTFLYIDTGEIQMVLRLLDKHLGSNLLAIERWASQLSTLPTSTSTANVGEFCYRDEDAIEVCLSDDVTGYTTGPRIERTETRPSVIHPTQAPAITKRIGLVITLVKQESVAEDLGLKAGMELISINGKPVKLLEYQTIRRLLDSGENDAVFSAPLEPNMIITIKGGEHVFGTKPRFANSGMILEHVHHARRHVSKATAEIEWCGFREHDEIISIDGCMCYAELGDTKAAHRLISNAWRYLRLHPSAELSFGIIRPSAVHDCTMSASQRLLELPAFRYASGIAVPHLATPVLSFCPGYASYGKRAAVKYEAVTASAWISHCGFILSLQPNLPNEPCVGIYLEDIDCISRVVELMPESDDDDSSNWDEAATSEHHPERNQFKLYISLDSLEPVAPSRSEETDAQGKQNGCNHISNGNSSTYSFAITFVGNGTAPARQLHIECETEFILRRVRHNLTHLTKAIVVAKKLSDERNSMLSVKEFKAELTRKAPRTFSLRSEDDSMDLHAQPRDSNADHYWDCYKEYIKRHTHGNHRHLQHTSVPPPVVAAKLAYQTRLNHYIVAKTIYREMVIPKLLKHAPAITRTERWAIISSAIQTGGFLITFFLGVQCFHVPKPALCVSNGKSFFSKFEPTWATVAAAVFSLCCSMPVPLTLMLFFKKAPVHEELNEDEKRVKRHTWRLFTLSGWMFFILLNGFYCYWLTVFTNEFHDVVMEKVVNAFFQSLFHRFVTAPACLAAACTLTLILSKYGQCCDCVLLTFPAIFIVSPLQQYHDHGETRALEHFSGHTQAHGTGHDEHAATQFDDDGGGDQVDFDVSF